MTHALMKVDHVLIKQPNAARRHGSTKIFRFACAMYPIECVFTVLEEI